MTTVTQPGTEPADRSDPVLMFTHHILVGYAKLGKTTTYGSLYDTLAARFGWRLRTNGNWWVDRLPLPQLGDLNRENGEPALASLVRQNKPGRPVGLGYETAHRNCHGIVLVGHDHPVKMQCDTCDAVINAAARTEARACFVFPSWP
jgi:hypothetical protein